MPRLSYRVPEDVKQQFINDYKQGWTYETLAEMHDVSVAAVKERIKVWGLTREISGKRR